MSKYTRKQKNKQQDQFLDFWQRAFLAVEPYLRALGITLGTAVVIVFAVWGVSSYYERRAEAATESFGRITRLYEAELLTGDTPPPRPPEGEEETAPPRYKTEKERADAALAELTQLEQKSSGSDVARRAALLKAGILYDLGKWDEAASIYERAAKTTEHPALVALAKEGLGLCHEARGKLDEALAVYRDLEPKGDRGDFFRDRALFAQARILTKKGDKAGALNLLKQLLVKAPTSPLKDEVENKLAALDTAP